MRRAPCSGASTNSAPASACCSAIAVSARPWLPSTTCCGRPCAPPGRTGAPPTPPPIWGRPRPWPGTICGISRASSPAPASMKANCAATCPTARASACTARTTPRPCAACIWMIWCWTSPPTCPAKSGARSCAPRWRTGRDGPCSAARPRAVTTCCMMSGSWRAVWGRRRAGHASASRPRRRATCRRPSWTPPASAWAWTAPSGNSTDAGPATCWMPPAAA